MKIGSRSTLREVAVAVGDRLRRRGIVAVLTGGACASLHSAGSYQSVDVDFVLASDVTRERLDAAMGELGFERRGDRYLHARTKFFVEFPRGPLGIGEDLHIRPVLAGLGGARTLTLSATDSCRDRLSAFYYWNDRQSLTAAIAIARRNRVRLSEIRRWSLAEGAPDRWKEFSDQLQKARARARRRSAD